MISYRPGTWFGIVGEHATVLLPPSEKARAGSLWVLIDDGAGFDEVLDALLADGLRALPGFILLTEEGPTTRIVVRGPSRAVFDTLGGEAVIEGSASATWIEKTLRDVTGLSVVLEESDEPLLALNSGLVRVAELVSPHPAAATPPAPPAAAPITTAPAPAPIQLAPQPQASGPYAAVLPFPAGVPSAPLTPPPPPPPVVPVPSGGDPLGEDPLGLGDLATSADEHAPEPQEAPEPPEAPAPSEELDVPSWLASDDPLTDQAEDYQDADGLAGSDESWADEPTGVLPVVPAADEDDEADEPTGPIAAEPPAWTPPAPATPPAPSDALSGSVPPPPPFPPVPPIAEAAPVPPAPLSPPAPQGGHDGLTPVGEPELDQPSVPAGAEQSVARLEFAHGERVDVDRVVIVGRAPEAGRFSQAEQPRLVAVPSPHQEISSTHIEIRPGSGGDHGSAVVTDLGSTNGTVVVQPGLGPEELRPGVPVPLAVGAMIDLGDGMTIRVAHP